MVEGIATAALTSPTQSVHHISPSKPAPTGAAAGTSFADFLSEAGQTALTSGNSSEKLGIQAVGKQGELVDIVTAVSNAEITLDTVLTIRDRLIQAYQEIVKTPI